MPPEKIAFTPVMTVLEALTKEKAGGAAHCINGTAETLMGWIEPHPTRCLVPSQVDPFNKLMHEVTGKKDEQLRLFKIATSLAQITMERNCTNCAATECAFMAESETS